MLSSVFLTKIYYFDYMIEINNRKHQKHLKTSKLIYEKFLRNHLSKEMIFLFSYPLKEMHLLIRFPCLNVREILHRLLKVTKWRDNDLLTANVEKISDAGENAEHMPCIALVPTALGPSDFCEV